MKLRLKRKIAFMLALVMVLLNFTPIRHIAEVHAESGAEWAAPGFSVDELIQFYNDVVLTTEDVQEHGDGEHPPVTVNYSISVKEDEFGEYAIETGEEAIFTAGVSLSAIGGVDYKNTVLALKVPKGFEPDVESIVGAESSNLGVAKVIRYQEPEGENPGVIMFYLDGDSKGEGLEPGRYLTLSFKGKYPTEVTPDEYTKNFTATIYTESHSGDSVDPDVEKVIKKFKISYETQPDLLIPLKAKADSKWEVEKNIIGEPSLVYRDIDGESQEVYKVDYQIDIFRSKPKNENGAWDFEKVDVIDELPYGGSPVPIDLEYVENPNLPEPIVDKQDTKYTIEYNLDRNEHFGDVANDDPDYAQGSYLIKIKEPILFTVYYKATEFEKLTLLENEAKVYVYFVGKEEPIEYSGMFELALDPSISGEYSISLEKTAPKVDKDNNMNGVNTYSFTKSDVNVDYSIKLKNTSNRTLNSELIDEELRLFDISGANTSAEIGKDYWFSDISVDKPDSVSNIIKYYKDASGNWNEFTTLHQDVVYGFKIVAEGMLKGSELDVNVTAVIAQRDIDSENYKDLRTITNYAYANANNGDRDIYDEALTVDASYNIGDSSTLLNISKKAYKDEGFKEELKEIHINDFTNAADVFYEIEVKNDGTTDFRNLVITDTGLKFLTGSDEIDVDYTFNDVKVSIDGVETSAEVDYSIDNKSFDAKIDILPAGQTAVAKVKATIQRKDKDVVFSKISNYAECTYKGKDQDTEHKAEIHTQVNVEFGGEINKVAFKDDKELTEILAEDIYNEAFEYVYKIYPENTSNGYLKKYIITENLPTLNGLKSDKDISNFIGYSKIVIHANNNFNSAIVYVDGVIKETITDTSKDTTILLNTVTDKKILIELNNVKPMFNYGAKNDTDKNKYYAIELHTKLPKLTDISMNDVYFNIANRVDMQWKAQVEEDKGNGYDTKSIEVIKSFVEASILKSVTEGEGNIDFTKPPESIKYTLSGVFSSNTNVDILYFGDGGHKLLDKDNIEINMPESTEVSDFISIDSVSIPVKKWVDAYKDFGIADKLVFKYTDNKDAITAANESWKNDYEKLWSDDWKTLGINLLDESNWDADGNVVINANGVDGGKIVKFIIVFEGGVKFKDGGEAGKNGVYTRKYENVIVTSKFNTKNNLTIADLAYLYGLQKIRNDGFWGYLMKSGTGIGGGSWEIEGDVITGFKPEVNLDTYKNSNPKTMTLGDLRSAGKNTINYTIHGENKSKNATGGEGAQLNSFAVYDRGINGYNTSDFVYAFNKIKFNIEKGILAEGTPIILRGYKQRFSDAASMESNTNYEELTTTFSNGSYSWEDSGSEYMAFSVHFGDAEHKVPAGFVVKVYPTAAFKSASDVLIGVTNKSDVVGYDVKGLRHIMSDTANTSITANVSAGLNKYVGLTAGNATEKEATVDYNELFNADQKLIYKLEYTNTGDVACDEIIVEDSYDSTSLMKFYKNGSSTPYTPSANDYTISKVIIPEGIDSKDASVMFINFSGTGISAVKNGNEFTPNANLSVGSIRGFKITLKNQKLAPQDKNFVLAELTLKKRGFSDILDKFVNTAKVTVKAGTKLGTPTTSTATVKFTEVTMAYPKVTKNVNPTSIAVDKITNDVPLTYTIVPELTGVNGSAPKPGAGASNFVLTDNEVVIYGDGNTIIYSSNPAHNKPLTPDVFKFTGISAAAHGLEGVEFDVEATTVKNDGTNPQTINENWAFDKPLNIIIREDEAITGFVMKADSLPATKLPAITVNAVLKALDGKDAVKVNNIKNYVKLAIVSQGNTQEVNAVATTTYAKPNNTTFTFNKTVFGNATSTTMDRSDLAFKDQELTYTITNKYNSGNIPTDFVITDNGLVFKTIKPEGKIPNYTIKEVKATFSGKGTTQAHFVDKDARQIGEPYEFKTGTISGDAIPSGAKGIVIKGFNFEIGSEVKADITVVIPKLDYSDFVNDYELIENTAKLEFSNKYYEGTPIEKQTKITIKKEKQSIVLSKASSGNKTEYKPGDVVEWTVYLSNGEKDSGTRKSLVVNPRIYDILPSQLSIAPDPNDNKFVSSYKIQKVKMKDNGNGVLTEVAGNYPELGEDEYTYVTDGQRNLSWYYKGNLEYLDAIKVTFNSKISSAALNGTARNWVYAGSSDQELTAKTSDVTEKANDRFDGLKSDSVVYKHSAEIPINIGNIVTVAKVVRGDIDDKTFAKGEWVLYPNKGKVSPGGWADYKVNVINTSGDRISKIVIAELLPYIGDVGIRTNTPRGTVWEPKLESVNSVYVTKKNGDVSAVDPAKYSYKVANDRNIIWNNINESNRLKSLAENLYAASGKSLFDEANAAEQQVLFLEMDSNFYLEAGEMLEFVFRVSVPEDVKISKNGNLELAVNTITLLFNNGSGFIEPVKCEIYAVGKSKLVIEKKIAGEGENLGLDKDGNPELFDFLIESQVTNNEEVKLAQVNGKDDEEHELIKNENGSYTLKNVKAGEAVTIEGLEPGSYTVTEIGSNTLYYETSYAFTQNKQAEISPVAAVAESNVFELNDQLGGTLTVTNTRKVGKLSVTKEIVTDVTDENRQLDDADKSKKFKFRVTGPNGFISNFELAHGETKELSGIPIGEYTVSELGIDDNEANGYFVDSVTENSVTIESKDIIVGDDSASVTVSFDNEAKVVFKNKKLYPGKIVIRKVMNEEDIIEGQYFVFSLTHEGKSGKIVERVTIYPNTVGKIKNLEVGKYKISEVEVWIEGQPVDIKDDLSKFKPTIEARGAEVTVSEDGFSCEFEVKTTDEKPVFIKFNNARKNDGEITVTKTLFRGAHKEDAIAENWEGNTFTVGIVGKTTNYRAEKELSQNNNVATFSNLPYDNYMVYEVAPGQVYDVYFDDDTTPSNAEAFENKELVAKGVEISSVKTGSQVRVDNVVKNNGKLKIVKEVVGLDGNIVNTGETFEFGIYQIIDGVQSDEPVKTAKIDLTQGNEVVVDGLVYGTYNIEEINYDESKYASALSGLPVRVSYLEDEANVKVVKATNTSLTGGKLALTKVVDGTVIEGQKFSFTITGPHGFNLQTTLEAGETKIIPEGEALLAPGKYTITENGVSSGSLDDFETEYKAEKVESEDSVVEIVSGEGRTAVIDVTEFNADQLPVYKVTFDNNRIEDGEISVVKRVVRVSGSSATVVNNWGKAWFKVRITGKNTNIVKEAILNNDNKGVKFTNLPYDEYVVTEVDPPAQYRVSISATNVAISSEIKEGDSVITNTYTDNTPPPQPPVIPPTQPNFPPGTPDEPTDTPPETTDTPPTETGITEATVGTELAPPPAPAEAEAVTIDEDVTPLGEAEIAEILDDEPLPKGIIPDRSYEFEDDLPKGNPKTGQSNLIYINMVLFITMLICLVSTISLRSKLKKDYRANK